MGVVPAEELRFSCENCRTVFVAARADIKSDYRDGDYVVCPTCKKWLDKKLGKPEGAA